MAGLFETPHPHEKEPDVPKGANDAQDENFFEKQNLAVESSVLESRLEPKDNQALENLAVNDKRDAQNGLEAVANSMGCDAGMIKLARLAGVNVQSDSSGRLTFQSHVEGTINPRIELTYSKSADIHKVEMQILPGQILQIRPFGKSSQGEMRVPLRETPQDMLEQTKNRLQKLLQDDKGTITLEDKGLKGPNEQKIRLKVKGGNEVRAVDILISPQFDAKKQCIVPTVTFEGQTATLPPKSLDDVLANVEKVVQGLQAGKSWADVDKATPLV